MIFCTIYIVSFVKVILNIVRNDAALFDFIFVNIKSSLFDAFPDHDYIDIFCWL